MANNFIEQNRNNQNKKKAVFSGENKEEIKWTKPISEDPIVQKSKKISLDSQDPKTKENISKSLASPKKQAKILSEKKEDNQKSFFDNFLSFFHFDKKEKTKSFQEKKEVLSAHQENINKEKDLKQKNSEHVEKKHKDIGEIVQEKLKENKIDINDGSIIKTNLMDGGPTIIVDWEKNVLFLSAGLFFSFLLVGVFYGFLLLKQESEGLEGEELDLEIQVIQSKIKNEKEELSVIDTLQRKLLIGKDILDKHIYWTNFFEFLEQNTLENVYYKNGLSGNAEGSYTFEAVTDSYRNITEQLIVLRDSDLVIEAEVSKGGMTEKDKKINSEESVVEKEINFDLSLKLLPEIFYK